MIYRENTTKKEGLQPRSRKIQTIAGGVSSFMTFPLLTVVEPVNIDYLLEIRRISVYLVKNE